MKLKLLSIFSLLVVLTYPLFLTFYMPIIGDDFQLLYSRGSRFIYKDSITFSDLLIASWGLTEGWYKLYHRLQGTYHHVTTFLFFYVTDFATYRIISFLSHVACLGLFALFLQSLTKSSSRVILLTIALIPTFFQFSLLFLPDALSEWFSAHILFFEIILLSFILHLRVDTKSNIWLNKKYLGSIFLYFLATQFYEVAFILPPAYFLLSLHSNVPWKDSIKLSLPYVVIGALAIIAWFLAKIIFKDSINNYPVTNIGFGIKSVISFFYQFISSFPLTNLSTSLSLYGGNLSKVIKWHDILYTLLAGVTSILLLFCIKKEKLSISSKQLFISFSLLLFFWICSVLPIALSTVYQIRLGKPYPLSIIGTYMLFGILFLSILTIYRNNKKHNSILIVSFPVIIMCCAFGNTLNNRIVILDKADRFFLDKNYEYALKNGLLESVENKKSTIILESPLKAWSKAAYIFHYSGKKVKIHQDWNEFILYDQDSTKDAPHVLGIREDKYNIVKHGNLIKFSPRDGVYYLSTREQGATTAFLLSRLSKVDLSKKEKPVFYTNETYKFEVKDGNISKEIISSKKDQDINKL